MLFIHRTNYFLDFVCLFKFCEISLRCKRLRSFNTTRRCTKIKFTDNNKWLVHAYAHFNSAWKSSYDQNRTEHFSTDFLTTVSLFKENEYKRYSKKLSWPRVEIN